MKRFIFTFLLFLCLFNNSFSRNTTQPVISTNRDTVVVNIADNDVQQIANIPQNSSMTATLSETAVNNIITWFSIAIGILTLLFAIIAVFEFSQVEKIKKRIKSYDDKMSNLSYLMAIQDHTMQTYNEFLYQSTQSIANGTNPATLLEEVTRNYHIAKLYSLHFDSNEQDSYQYKLAAFNYLQQKGKRHDIRHLEYVADHDKNKQCRDRAREVIGHIKERDKLASNLNQNNDDKNVQNTEKHSWFCSLTKRIFNR